MPRLACLFLLLAFALPAQAQGFESAVPETVVAWTATVRPPTTAAAATDTFAPGEGLFVTLNAEVAPGWRLYALRSPGGLPLQLHLDPLPPGLRLAGSPGEDATHEGYDTALEQEYRYHSARARVWQRLEVARNAAPGPVEVTGRVRYAACNDAICLPPREAPFRARLVIR
jgi:thiol:disulfide interchange protein DsbD